MSTDRSLSYCVTVQMFPVKHRTELHGCEWLLWVPFLTSSFFFPPGLETVSVTVGNSFVLACPSKSNVIMVTWKINHKVGGACTLGYRADQNKTDRTNCSDSINWKPRSDQDPALEIQQVEVTHEGNYICEVVTTDGNFEKQYHLTVLGKRLLPHFIVLQRVVSGPGCAKLLTLCIGDILTQHINRGFCMCFQLSCRIKHHYTNLRN